MIKKILYLFLVTATISFSQDNFPEWARGIVWYQIFPERFANGDSKNDPTADKVFANHTPPADWKTTKWTSNWFDHSTHFGERRYGGDLKGIIDHLDYLKDLGVKGIYLNPIFEAVSSHKYDGSSYHHIDVNFGPDPVGDKKLIASETPYDPSTWKWTAADKLFLSLIQEVHKRGMYIVIDGVFNHVGTEFWAFKDVIKNQQSSKFVSWFNIKRFDNPSTKENEFDYQGWWNLKSLPQFNRTSSDLADGPKKYIFYATQRWMDPNANEECSDGIDGWRLDVARDIPIGFWKDWSKHVKSINPKAIIIGELWEISKDFISDNGPFDALMNYNFAYAVNKFFIAESRRIKTSEFIARLKEVDQSYPERNVEILQNLLDSHDTERLSSMVKNPDRDFDLGGNQDNPNYDPSKPGTREINKLKLITAFQLMYKGAPMIYYGDETGMWGGDDPGCRKPMLWKDLKYDNEVIDSTTGFKKGFGSYKVEVDNELFNHYKKLLSIRNNNSALVSGDLNFVYSDDINNAFAFLRKDNNEQVLCVYNLGSTAINVSVPFESKKVLLQNLFTDEQKEQNTEGTVTVEMKPQSFSIYKLLVE